MLFYRVSHKTIIVYLDNHNLIYKAVIVQL